MKALKETGTSGKSGHKSGHTNDVVSVEYPDPSPKQTQIYSKGDARFWADRVERLTRPIAGEKKAVPYGSFLVRIKHDGRRERFSLGTTDKATAKAKAAEIYRTLDRDGWDVALRKFKPAALKREARAAGVIVEPTVGQFIAEVVKLSRLSKTAMTGCCRCFRRIVADVAGVDGDAARFDYVHGGAEAWRAKVDAVKLDILTPAKVKAWMNGYVAKVSGDPLAERKAKITANSFRRQAKALFSNVSRGNEGVMDEVRKLMHLPAVLPFEGKQAFTKISMQYQSKQFGPALLASARDELAESNPEAFKVLVLALCCGLRRNEIDKLLWEQVDFTKGVIRIEATKYFRPKSEDSIGEVDLDAEIVAMMRGWQARAKGVFVVESSVSPRMGGAGAHYRTNRIMGQLREWLQKHGIEDRKFLHVLRKEFGSMVNDVHGIYVASKALRHADTQVTVQHYTSKMKRITIGMGKMLVPENVEVVDFAGAGPEVSLDAPKKGRAKRA